MTPAQEVRLTSEFVGSQKRLAELIPARKGGHVSERTVRRWVAGETEPSPLVLD